MKKISIISASMSLAVGVNVFSSFTAPIAHAADLNTNTTSDIVAHRAAAATIGEYIDSAMGDYEQLLTFADKGILDVAYLESVFSNLEAAQALYNGGASLNNTDKGNIDDLWHFYNALNVDDYEVMGNIEEAKVYSGNTLEILTALKSAPIGAIGNTGDIGTPSGATGNSTSIGTPSGAIGNTGAVGAPSGAAAVIGLSNFNKGNSLSFSDVNQSDWFYSTVSEVSAYGIINGVDDSHFEPQGNLTIGQAIALASRVHAIYYSSEIPAADASHWASGALNYALSNSIASNISISDLDNLASRGLMAQLFYNSVDSKEFANTINSGNGPAMTIQALKEFYRAGIMTDARENDNVTRAEAAAIILRVIDSSKRMEDKKQDTGSSEAGNIGASDIGSSSAANASEASSNIGTSSAGSNIGTSEAGNTGSSSAAIGTAASTVSAAAFDANYVNAAGHRNYATIRSAVSSYNGGLNLGNQINVLPSGAKVGNENYSEAVRYMQSQFTSGIIDFISASPHMMSISYRDGYKTNGFTVKGVTYNYYNDDGSHSGGIQIKTRFGSHVYTAQSQQEYDWLLSWYGNVIDNAIYSYDFEAVKANAAAKYPCSGDPRTTLEARGGYTIEEARDIYLYKSFSGYLKGVVSDAWDAYVANRPGYTTQPGDVIPEGNLASSPYAVMHGQASRTCETDMNYNLLIFDYIGLNCRGVAVTSGHAEMFVKVVTSNDDWYMVGLVKSDNTEKAHASGKYGAGKDEVQIRINSTLATDLTHPEQVAVTPNY